jgi:hypothetical protein
MMNHTKEKIALHSLKRMKKSNIVTGIPTAPIDDLLFIL